MLVREMWATSPTYNNLLILFISFYFFTGEKPHLFILFLLLIIIKIFSITCSWYNYLLILIIFFTGEKPYLLILFFFNWRETISMHFVWHRKEATTNIFSLYWREASFIHFTYFFTGKKTISMHFVWHRRETIYCNTTYLNSI